MSQPVFKPFPHYIEVSRQENGKLRCKTNTHLVEDVSEDQLEYITYPYAGVGCTFELKCEDPELRTRVYKQMEKGTDLFPYFNDSHPVMAQAFYNWVMMQNHPDRYLSIQSLKDIAKDKTILFLGAGQSFLDNKEIVKELHAKGKVITIAGGSGIRQALNNDIPIDFALAFDPRVEEKHVLTDKIAPELMKKTRWICNQGLYHEVFEVLPKAYVTCSSSLPDMCQFMEPDEPILYEGRIGVSTMVPYVAAYMGAKELVYLGVDLKTSDSGTRYTDCTDNHDPILKEAPLDKLIDDKDKRRELTWAREVVDIQNTADILKASLPMFNASDRSNLTLPKKELKKLFKNKSFVTLKIDDIAKDFGGVRPIDKILQLERELTEMLDDPKCTENPKYSQYEAMISVIGTYHLMQQFRKVRTGDYNHVLIKGLIKNVIGYLDEAIQLHAFLNNADY